MNENIFILDDEADIVDLVVLHLQKNGFKTRGFCRTADLLAVLPKTIPDLLILDLMLPDMDGIELCKQLKNDSKYRKIPVIMLTAKQDETDKILGLELGADDYITKPFSPKELVARVKAVLRRGKELAVQEIITIDNLLRIDLQKHAVFDTEGKKMELTHSEFKILYELAKKRGWVLSREILLKSIWGEDVYVIDRNIDVHIRHLREKLGQAGELIINVRGVGYKLEE